MSVAQSTIPDWLSTKSLSKKRYRLGSTGNLHGLQAQEFLGNLYPLPKMFGDEGYAYSLIDIDDPRYLDDCAFMSRRLIQLFNESQIIDIQWKKCYNNLSMAENRFGNLPPSASQKARDALKEDVKDAKKKLLELQEQKDLYCVEINTIFDKCAAIKASIKKENDLDQLREEMTNATRAKYKAGDAFWDKTFNVAVERDEKDDDPLAHIDFDEAM